MACQRLIAFLDTRRGAFLALMVVYILGVALLFALTGRTIYGPTHFDDEVRYWQTTNDLFHGVFSVGTDHHSPPVYPIALLPALWLFPADQTYDAAKVLNILYLASILFPVFLLLRVFANRSLSLLGAALVLVFPTQVVMPRSMISENLFYPLFLWAVCLAFRNFSSENSRWRVAENIGFGLLCGALVLTRYIALAVIPGIFLIWWLKPLSSERGPLLFSRKKALAALTVFLPFLMVIAAWVLPGLREGAPLKELLGFGIADDPNPAQLGRRRLVMWAVFYLSYTALQAAPFVGVLSLGIFQVRWKEWRGPLARWLLAVAIICALLLVACIRHSWRAAYNYPDPLKIQGRYILYFVPLFWIAAFAMIHKLNWKKPAWSEAALAILVCGQAVALAFWILYRGGIYLGHPLEISVNSSDGDFIRLLDGRFLGWFAVLLVVGILLAGRQRTAILPVLLVLLAAYYVYGDTRLYTRFLKPGQYFNYQAYRLVSVLEEQFGHGPALLQTPVRLSLTDRIENSDCRAWVRTMQFRGFTDVKCVRNGQSGENDPTVFVAQVKGNAFTLTNLGKGVVQASGLAVFSFGGETFVIR